MDGVINADSDVAYERNEASSVSTSFAGKLPQEVRDFVDGHPYLRTLFKGNVPKGGGEDVARQMGYDAYFDAVLAMKKGKTTSALEAAEKASGGDPDAAMLLRIHKAYGQKRVVDRKPFMVVDKPGDLPEGTTLSIGGEEFTVARDQWGATMLNDKGEAVAPLWMDSLPVDAGSLKGPEPKPVAKPDTLKSDRSLSNVFNRELPPTQGSLMDVSPNRPTLPTGDWIRKEVDVRPKTGDERIDAQDDLISKKFDPKATPELGFGGDEPSISRARTDEPPDEDGISEGGPETTGIAHRVSEAQGMEVERGVGISAEDSRKRGRELRERGMDWKKVVAQFKKNRTTGDVPFSDAVALVADAEVQAAKHSTAVDEKYGAGSPQSNKAFQEWVQAKEDAKLIQTEWHKGGMAQQGEVEIDTGTFHGMRAAHHEAGGKDFTPKQADAAKKLVEEVQATTKAEETAKQELLEAAKSVDDLEPNARSLADRIITKLDKASAESLDWLKKNYLSGTTLRSGLDPTALYHMSRYGAAKIAKGAIRFSEWSTSMVKDLGESIRPHLKTIWEAADKELDRQVMADSSHAEAVKQVRSKPKEKNPAPAKIAAKAKADTPPAGLANIAKELSRAFIRQGVVEREANVSAVHEVLSDAVPGMTREQVSDAMSGYGNYRPLSKDPVEVRRREIAGEVQQVRKLQDMAGGKAPLRSGVERQAPTDEARDLIRRVNEAKKAGGYITTDPATQLRTSLDARKTYVRNRITDLQKQIDAGVKAKKDNKPAPTDAQLDAMRAKLKEVQDRYDKRFAPADVSAHPPGTQMTPERVKALWQLAIPHVQSGVTTFHTLADTLARQTGLPTADIRQGLSAKGPAKKTLAELDNAAWALYKAKKNAKDWLRSQAPKTPLQRVLYYSGAMRALETTGEISVLGIQAGSRIPISVGHAITHPLNPKMLRQDIRTLYRGLSALSPRKAREIDNAMERDPLYLQAKRDGVRIYDEEHTPSGVEEIKTQSFIEKVWGVGHGIRAFNRLSRIALNDIKLNQYKTLAETLPGTPSKKEGKVIADIANLIGGTTNMGGAEKIMGGANAVLYSARLAAARARFLASPVEFSIRGTNETRKAYAKQMAYWMIGNAAIYSAFTMAGYEVGDDPLSNKFGKVKIGEAWVDMTGGLSSYITFSARQATGETVTNKDNRKDLGGPGPYDPSRLSIASTFARGKLSPWASLFVDWMDNQTNIFGKPMDAEYFARKVSPLTWWDVAQAIREETPTDAAAISVLALFGKGVRNRPEEEESGRPRQPSRPTQPPSR
jgi:hypothetical protein